jgi:hypothetical protein
VVQGIPPHTTPQNQNQITTSSRYFKILSEMFVSFGGKKKTEIENQLVLSISETAES